jgi:beta-glucosidase/6-phospho-beta-glucosidase/beta-galactosidase
MGGFECATHINTSGHRLDMIAGVQHDVQAEHDYALLKAAGMSVARDGARWHLIEHAGHYDWSSFQPMFEAAQRQHVQVIWDVCHYGWPDGLDVFQPEFIDRFARFAGALAAFIKNHSDEVPFYAPMNEINFLTWGASRDLIYPFAFGRDDELKRQLVRATIAGCEAILQVDPRARFVYPEPTIMVTTPRNRPDLASQAKQYDESQFDAWNLIAGYEQPELGGHPKYLDVLGSNFYHSNEWEIEGNGRLRWEDEPRDDRWVPLSRLLRNIHERYRRPLFVAETSHVGSGRARWMTEIGQEIFKARQEGTPVEGVCLYPIIDRYDWQDPNHWHNSGLWDFRHDPDGKLVRIENPSYAAALADAQTLLASIGCI